MGVALSTLTDIPFVVKRALAEGGIGTNGKKLLFIFMRGANDALNSVVPIQDSAYGASIRPDIYIPKDTAAPASFYSNAGSCFDATAFVDYAGTARTATDATFAYNKAIPLGNGFAALHPSLKFLAPVYNSGDLAIIHRVGYPRQSRSHFDSQNYWETGSPNNNLVTDGIFYRTLLESGLAKTSPLTGVSVQSALPLLLRGSGAAMTNLTDPTRYNLLGLPNNSSGNYKADNAIRASSQFPIPPKLSRDLLNLQYENLAGTLSIFANLDFSDAGNTFVDNVNTDGDDAPYYLFPTSNAKNGGYALHGNDASKYVVDTGAYSYFGNLKAAAVILNNTDAIIAGTEFTGFDTHNNQGGVTGTHANLQRRLAWSMYGLKKYFSNYANKVNWNDIIVVTLSEFGRTTVQNGSLGTDHAEAGVMFVAGGSVKGRGKPGTVTNGIFGLSPSVITGDSVAWVTGPANQAGGVDGSMFGVSDRYLKRSVDYRSVLGKLIRDHLGASQGQLDRIIPGYTVAGEKLFAGGTSTVDNTAIIGEPQLL